MIHAVSGYFFPAAASIRLHREGVGALTLAFSGAILSEAKNV
jgi:hypothetical protein